MKEFSAVDTLKIQSLSNRPSKAAPSVSNKAKAAKSKESIKSEDGEEPPKIKPRRTQPQLSSEEVRDKIRLEQNRKLTANNIREKSQSERPQYPLDSEIKELPPAKKSVPASPVVSQDTDNENNDEKAVKVVAGDIKLNDPNDPNTREKLKTMMKSGGFNFSPQERSALAQILKD